MAEIEIKHSFQSTQPQSALTAKVRKNDWNAKLKAVGATVGSLFSLGASDTVQEVSPAAGFLKSAGTGAPAFAGVASQTFRGLHVRTHPDQDVAASKILLVHAEEIVMDDGQSVLDWNNLVADITVAGAGGLDVGAEGASRWYEIYAIRKSSDGTKGLLLHRAKNFLEDEASTAGEDGSHGLRNATNNVKLGQSFAVDVAGPVPFVDVKIIREGSVVGQVWLTIEADNAGAPSGVPLATSDKLDAAAVSTSAQWIRVPFRVPAALTATTTYWLVLQGNYTPSNTVRILWRADTSAATYVNGMKSKTDDGSAWTSDADDDFLFKVYVTENDTLVTMPSGYDQRALIGWVYNNSGSNFRKMSAIDRRVRLEDVTIVGGFTTGYPILTDLSAFAPPVPVEVLVYSAGTAGDRLALGAVPDGYIGGSASLYSFLPHDNSGRGSAIYTTGGDWQAVYVWLINGTSSTTLVHSGFNW